MKDDGRALFDTNILLVESRELSTQPNYHQIGAGLLEMSLVCGAKILYTEDLNHGQQYGVVRAFNPFRSPLERTTLRD